VVVRWQYQRGGHASPKKPDLIGPASVAQQPRPRGIAAAIDRSDGQDGRLADAQGCFSDQAAGHSKRRIETAPFQRGVQHTGSSCVSFEET
jgi:hypothetical protein